MTSTCLALAYRVLILPASGTVNCAASVARVITFRSVGRAPESQDCVPRGVLAVSIAARQNTGLPEATTDGDLRDLPSRGAWGAVTGSEPHSWSLPAAPNCCPAAWEGVWPQARSRGGAEGPGWPGAPTPHSPMQCPRLLAACLPCAPLSRALVISVPLSAPAP